MLDWLGWLEDVFQEYQCVALEIENGPGLGPLLDKDW